jgi:hypothetical protein
MVSSHRGVFAPGILRAALERPALLQLTLLCCTLNAVGSARAQPAVVTGAPSTVVFIRSATSSKAQRHEQRLFEELGFALDTFMLLSEDAGRSDFDSLSLADQIAHVLPDARKNEAAAVIWLSFPLANQVMLHVITLGPGRALIRTVETDRSPVSERTLALMAREMLGTAYLFEPPAEVPADVKQVVQQVKEQIAPPKPPPPAPPEERTSLWSLWARGRTTYPLFGGVGSVPVLDLGLALERELPQRFSLSLGITGRYGALTPPAADGTFFVSGGAGLTAFRGFSAGPVVAGPYLGAELSYAAFMAPMQAPVRAWLPRFQAGAQLRPAVTRGLTLELRVGVSLSPLHAEVGSGEIPLLYRVPLLELEFGLAVGWAGV